MPKCSRGYARFRALLPQRTVTIRSVEVRCAGRCVRDGVHLGSSRNSSDNARCTFSITFRRSSRSGSMAASRTHASKGIGAVGKMVNKNKKTFPFLAITIAFIGGLVMTWLLWPKPPVSTGRISTASPYTVTEGDTLPSESTFRDVAQPLISDERLTLDSLLTLDVQKEAHEPASTWNDDQWLTFGRLYELVHRLYEDPYSIEAKHLFRHEKLNPRDQYIRPSAREQLASLVEFYSPQLGKAWIHAARLRDEEFDSLIQMGAMRPLEYTDDPKVLASMNKTRRASAADGIPGEPVFFGAIYYNNGKGLTWFRRYGERTYGAANSDLPRYQHSKTIQREVSTSYLESIIVWFVAQGVLKPIEAMSLYHGVELHFDRLQRNER